MSERYIEDNSYDSKKHISRHIRDAKFHFSTFMISVVFVIYIILSFFLVSPNKKGKVMNVELNVVRVLMGKFKVIIVF